MRIAASLVVFLTVIVATQAQAPPHIVHVWSAYDKESEVDPVFEMIPLKVKVKTANPEQIIFKLGATTVEHKHLAAEETDPGTHLFRLAPLPYGKAALTAWSKKPEVSSAEFVLQIKDPPKLSIEAIFEPGGVAAKLPKKGATLQKLDTFFVVLDRFEEGDGWIPHVGGAAAGTAELSDRQPAIVKITLPPEVVKDKKTVQFQLRLKRNRFAGALSDPVDVSLPGQAPEEMDVHNVASKAAKGTHRFPFPFTQGPQIIPIEKGGPIGRELGDCCNIPKFCSLEECAKKENLRTMWYRFAGAAHFPHPRFGDAGEAFAASGTIIYEGMMLTVAEDGRYEVVFNASTPAIPVTLRMTMRVFVRGQLPIELTLPAIPIVPLFRQLEDLGGNNRTLDNNFQQNWHIRHVGHSQILGILATHKDAVESISRDGVARFGSLPQSR